MHWTREEKSTPTACIERRDGRAFLVEVTAKAFHTNAPRILCLAKANVRGGIVRRFRPPVAIFGFISIISMI